MLHKLRRYFQHSFTMYVLTDIYISGETHELHAASGSQPGIVVHVCEEKLAGSKGMRISHTRCPDHN